MRAGFLFGLVIFVLRVSAQAPDRFYTRFGGSGDDIAYSGKPTLDGNYIIAGSTTSWGIAGNTDVYLVKVDKMGFPMWEKYIGGTENDIGRAVIQLADSGYMVAGYTSSYGAGGYDVFVVRTDKNGNLIWQNTYGGTDWDFAYDLVQASDGNVFIVGNTSSFGGGKKDGYLTKIDLAGNLLLQKTYGGVENEELKSIIKTNDNFLATVGYTESRGEINGDGYFLKLDLNADTLFTRTFGGPYKDYACDLVQKNINDYIIAGAKTFGPNEKSKSYMHSIKFDGTFTWDNSYYVSSDDENYESLASSMLLPDLTAYLRNIPVPDFKSQGNLWLASPGGWNYLVNSFGGEEEEEFFSIEGTSDGGFLNVGSTNSYGSLGRDIIIVKVDSTIVNYESVVNVNENYFENKWHCFGLENKRVGFQFPDYKEVETISLFDLNGRLVNEFKCDERFFEREFYFLQNAIYLVKVKFKNGAFQYTKVSLF